MSRTNRLTRVWRANDLGTNGDDEKLLAIDYDALGRRVESDEFIDTADGEVLADANVTVHVYVGLGAIEEYAVTTNGVGGYNADIAREFVWGARFPEPVAMIDRTDMGDIPSGTPEVLHYLHDVLGSVVALTNTNGQVVERYDYDPYGTTTVMDAVLDSVRQANGARQSAGNVRIIRSIRLRRVRPFFRDCSICLA